MKKERNLFCGPTFCQSRIVHYLEMLSTIHKSHLLVKGATGPQMQKINKMATQSSKALDIGGIFPPIPTPFTENEEINYTALKSNIDRWNQTNIKGYLVQGSNGEYCYLTHEERVEMVKKVREFAPNKLVLAGSGCESTRQTIELTRAMAKEGADAAVVVTPCYFKASMNSDALRQHFISVADQSPIPVILYSVPANTGIDLPVDVVIDLCRHPNIIGMKDSGGDISKIAKMVYETNKNGNSFSILAGSASFLLPALQVGAVGGICALANVLPNEVCEVYEKFRCGEDILELQYRLIDPNAAVTRNLGVPGLKTALSWFGYYGGPTRKPLLPLTSKQEEILKNAFRNNGFL